MQDAKTLLPAGLEEPKRVRLIRRTIGLGLLLVAASSVAVWLLTRETLPKEIRVATAMPGGLYHKFSNILEPQLGKWAQRPIRKIDTQGSVENQALLRGGEVHVAFLQGGAGSLDGLVAIAPLYYDVVHVIVRRDRGIRSILDLHGRRIAIGKPRSGMLDSSLDLLEHYELDEATAETRYFADLKIDPELDAAIATTGLFNPDLNDLLKTQKLELLPIRDARALALLHPHFSAFTIPRGLFGESPAVPSDDIETLATTSFVAVRADASNLLVSTVLEALYEKDLRHDMPIFIPRGEAAQWNALPLHPAARRFFRPYSGLEVLANFMESLAALKELLFALGAGLYLAWIRWQRLKERAQLEVLQVGKDRLDVFLEETIRIERQMLELHQVQDLQIALRKVTDLKHQAISELTHESLRGDVSFSIFLQQCGDVIRRIQTKLQLARQGVSFEITARDDHHASNSSVLDSDTAADDPDQPRDPSSRQR